MDITKSKLKKVSFSPNNHLSFFTPVFDRYVDVFLISEILDYYADEEDNIEMMKNFFVREINRNEYIENTKKEHKNLLMEEYYIQLKKMEEKWFIDASASSIEEFEKFKEEKNDFFGENIEQLEAKIKQYVGKHFKFDELLLGNDDENNLIIEKILIFYRFVLNSNIFSQEMLFKCIFMIKENEELDETKTLAATLNLTNGEKAIIILEFHENWIDERMMKNGYFNGLYPSADYFSTFVHEFAHVIHNVYALSEIQLKNLNRNYKITDGESSDEIAEKNLENEFGQENIYKRVMATPIINVALSTIYDKFNILQEPRITTLSLAKWTAVPSFYGRGPSSTEEDYAEIEKGDREWFAEAFTYYYSTPKEQRSKIWEWWHEIFTKILPEKFNQKITYL